MAKGEGAESGSAAGLLPTGILQAGERPAQVKKEPKKKQQLTICNKLCYAVGGAPYQVTGCALGFFLQIYLLDVAQVDPFPASIILFVGRAWDAFTDPLVGFCISKSSWTPLGRLMPWSSPFGTCFSIASLRRWSRVSTFPTQPSPCSSAQSRVSGILPQPTQNAYLLAAGVIASIYVICAVILTLGVREQREPYETQQAEQMSFFRGLRLVMGHGPYIKLIAGFLFTSLAFMLVEGNFALFCTYTLGFRNEFQNLLLAIMLSATFTIPIWQWFLTRFGKKTAVYIGISSAVPFLILVALMESNLIITYVVAVAAGISVAAAFLLPWSMLPDVIDDFHLKQPHSHGTEPIFFSFYVFFTKFASGISLGISTLSLDFAGYQTRGCSQPAGVRFTLKMLVTMAPIVLILLGLLLFKLYPIDEEKRRQNKKALQALRDEASSSGCSDTDSTELASIL
ncbi:sodium-dependent lysophosphatidylcholine symporter 1 isoform X2 [Nycticebus coucang]|uniref:sodium-dependent lysophosphatidylcholine symporter 1 isoform X2 n=1 Tax=Nycticebus coucang TaxID=9470 RepID=UPI00234C1395|nr:sodium-dependent lysophosphatidylcholine symporter 1 isoform X2 [Nycticebus coucang]